MQSKEKFYGKKIVPIIREKTVIIELFFVVIGAILLLDAFSDIYTGLETGSIKYPGVRTDIYRSKDDGIVFTYFLGLYVLRGLLGSLFLYFGLIYLKRSVKKLKNLR